MTKKEISALIRRIEAARKAIGEQRDDLRDLMSDIEALKEASDDATEYLGMAVDRLSELT